MRTIRNITSLRSYDDGDGILMSIVEHAHQPVRHLRLTIDDALGSKEIDLSADIAYEFALTILRELDNAVPVPAPDPVPATRRWVQGDPPYVKTP